MVWSILSFASLNWHVLCILELTCVLHASNCSGHWKPAQRHNSSRKHFPLLVSKKNCWISAVWNGNLKHECRTCRRESNVNWRSNWATYSCEKEFQHSGHKNGDKVVQNMTQHLTDLMLKACFTDNYIIIFAKVNGNMAEIGQKVSGVLI